MSNFFLSAFVLLRFLYPPFSLFLLFPFPPFPLFRKIIQVLEVMLAKKVEEVGEGGGGRSHFAVPRSPRSTGRLLGSVWGCSLYPLPPDLIVFVYACALFAHILYMFHPVCAFCDSSILSVQTCTKLYTCVCMFLLHFSCAAVLMSLCLLYVYVYVHEPDGTRVAHSRLCVSASVLVRIDWW